MFRSIDTLIADLADKRILILGFGREGRSSYAFLRKHFPEKMLGIADKNNITLTDPAVALHCGAQYLDAMGDYDIVLKSPGIPFVGVDIPPRCTVSCQTDLFLKYSDSTVIGVTGTKGKTTTATLIFRMLQAAGLRVRLVGNVGVPVLDHIGEAENEITVMELSCHQLEFMTTSPHIAVITNIYEEHLDHYNNGFAGYLAAKMNIAAHQQANDFFIYNPKSTAGDYITPETLPAKVILADPTAPDAFLDELAAANPHLRGSHNRQNICVAMAVVRRLGVPDAAIRKAILDFEGIANRMELVGIYNEVAYYNDSIATIPYSVIMGVDSLGNVGSLLIGGMDRGLDYQAFADQLARRQIDNIICLPDTGHKIAELLQERHCRSNIVLAADMEEAVRAAVKLTPKGKACVLSPAAASYNVYRDFEEKGNHFKTLVKQYGKQQA